MAELALTDTLTWLKDVDVAVTRFGGTCSSLQELVTRNERFWSRMYKRRWTFSNISQATFSLQERVNRHAQDRETIRHTELISESLENEEDYGLGAKRHKATWSKICKQINPFSILYSKAKNDRTVTMLYNNEDAIPVNQALATEFLGVAHFDHVLKNLINLKLRIHEGRDGTVALEEVVLLLTQSLWTWQEFLSSPPQNRIRAI